VYACSAEKIAEKVFAGGIRKVNMSVNCWMIKRRRLSLQYFRFSHTQGDFELKAPIKSDHSRRIYVFFRHIQYVCNKYPNTDLSF